MPKDKKQHKPLPKTSWEKISQWYGSYLDREHTLQNEVVFPNTLKLLDTEPTKEYLDLACGEGGFARLLIKERKVKVVGVDASPSLIERARSLSEGNAKFVVADARKFVSEIPNLMFEGAVCILAIQNIDPIGEVFSQAAKVLKPNRPFVIVMNHPSFRQPKASGWEWDEKKKMQYRRVDSYLGRYEVPITAHPGAAPHVKTYSYHRPLETYVKELAKAGFKIDAMEEWISNKVSDSGPRAEAENRARKEIPMFLAIRAIRNK